MQTTQTLQLRLPKLPTKARRAFQVPKLSSNLITVRELRNAGCTVFFTKHSAEIDYDGEVIGRAWRNPTTRLWRMPITSEGGTHVTPETHPDEFDTTSSMILYLHAQSIYECSSQGDLIRYYHAALGSPIPMTMIKAANVGYLRGCPGLSAKAIRKQIKVGTAAIMGHMKQNYQGTRSATKPSTRGRPKTQQKEPEQHPMAPRQQEPNNAKTHRGYMTTAAHEGLLACDQTREACAAFASFTYMIATTLN